MVISNLKFFWGGGVFWIKTLVISNINSTNTILHYYIITLFTVKIHYIFHSKDLI